MEITRKRFKGKKGSFVHRGSVALVFWIFLSFAGLVGVLSTEHHDKNKIYSADIPTDKEHEISILIGARSDIGTLDDNEGGTGNSTVGDDSGEESQSSEGCGIGSNCCFQYTWPGYQSTIPEAENATCDYWRKRQKDDKIACFDPMVFTKPRVGNDALGSPPDYNDLTTQARANNYKIFCHMSAKTCVTYTFFNDQNKMENRTHFCGMVTDNNDKQLRKGCYRQAVGGMVREVCVCDTNLCNSRAFSIIMQFQVLWLIIPALLSQPMIRRLQQ